MGVPRDRGRASPPAPRSGPAASRSRASREPRKPAPPVMTTFTMARLRPGPSARVILRAPGDRLLDRGLHLRGTLHVRHVPGAVDQAADRAGQRLGLRRGDDPVFAAPE